MIVQKMKHVAAMGNVQRHATKQVPGLRNLPYEDRQHQLNLPTQTFCRLRGDMTEVFKIFSSHHDPTTVAHLGRGELGHRPAQNMVHSGNPIAQNAKNSC